MPILSVWERLRGEGICRSREVPFLSALANKTAIQIRVFCYPSSLKVGANWLAIRRVAKFIWRFTPSTNRLMGRLTIDKVPQCVTVEPFYNVNPRLRVKGLFFIEGLFDFPRASGNVPQECIQLPALVGSLAPILGEVPSAYKANKLDLDCYRGFEPRRPV